MPYPKGTKIKCRPCTRKKERLIATNANNFTSEHVESDQHEGAMADSGLELLYAPTLVGNSMLKYVWQHF